MTFSTVAMEMWTFSTLAMDFSTDTLEITRVRRSLFTTTLKSE